MQARFPDFQQRHCAVVVVSFAPPARVAAFLDEFPLPFPMLSDPSHAAYQAFGLGKTSWRSMLRLGVVGRLLKLMWHGWMPRQPDKGVDVFQLGGDFILDEQRRVRYAHRSAEPTDRPTVDNLLAALR